MCGICGVFSAADQLPDRDLITRMTDVLKHRGPNDQRVYAQGPIGLGVARLAIIDLSPAAHQPMSNEDETVWIAYNGEVYNHRELRQELETRGHRYRSQADTESVLHAYEEYGYACLDRLRGMYALAIWDSRQQNLFLAVDRLGIKPLYYTQVGATFLFASEVKAILQHPAVRRQIDFQALDEYLRYCYIPSPRTIFQGIRRLPPAHYMVVREDKVEIKRYWNVRFQPDPTRTEADWAEETLELLRQSVRMQLMSDVPLGCFLSGGMDSSALVALMSQTASRPVKTFTIGFRAQGKGYSRYDEVEYARLVARRFGTEHHEFIVEPKVLDVLPKVVWHFDEPFANVTAIPAYYMCQAARPHVTVALAGVGGDEAFAGYPRYLAARGLASYFRIPHAIRERMLKRLAAVLPERPSEYALGNRIKKFIAGAAESPEVTYRNWMSFFSDDARHELYLLEGAGAPLQEHEFETAVDTHLREAGADDFLSKAFYADIKSYLPDNLLTYSDRMSMAHSLEIRVPFCDHRLIEFAATIPHGLKIKRFGLKAILKRAMAGLLPHETLARRKQGFSVPVGYWLQNELLPLARSLLSRDRIERRGYWNHQVVETMLREHLSGKINHTNRLWALIVFEVWHSIYLDQSTVRAPSFSLGEWEASM